jgi:cephalosporin hydroxylase
MSMSDKSKFDDEVRANITAMAKDARLRADSIDWMVRAGGDYKYSYNFAWMGRPIIQYPQDIVALQEIIWAVKPDLVIEMGIAHGGSLILSASILALIEYADAAESGTSLDPGNPSRRVLGVDIDIREHNRAAIEAHPMSSRIDMIEGSSIEDSVIRQVQDYASSYSNVLVILDSNHTHAHVLAELNAYAHLTSVGSYCIVFDTVIEDTPEELLVDRPWSKVDNPKTAVREFLATRPNFELDTEMENKLLITVAPEGFLKRTA